MKKLLYLIVTCLVTTTNAQDLNGAWERFKTDSIDREVRIVAIFTDKIYSYAYFDAKSGEFIATEGGILEFTDKTIKQTTEFNTANSSVVGTSASMTYEMKRNKMENAYGNWKRIDSGNPGELSGAWLMSGRIRNGETQQRDTNRPRKTMKILSGTRFQWIAYNTETKRFMGTGGGTYTTIDGKYTENIEFFSRDGSRVGAALEFNYEMNEGKWHHSGNNSRGQPLYEIWSVREK